MSDKAFVPLRMLVPWPEDLFPIPAEDEAKPTALDLIGVSAFGLEGVPDGQKLSVTLEVLGEATIGLAGVEGLMLVLGKAEEGSTSLQTELVIGENCSFKLTDFSLGLRFPPAWLKPYKREADDSLTPEPVGSARTVSLDHITVTVDKTGLSFESAPSVALLPVMVGSTGVFVEAGAITPILSDSAAARLPAGLPSSSRGVLLDDVRITLPKDFAVPLPREIDLDDFFLGSGGVTGRVTGTWAADQTGELAGIPFAPLQLSLAFEQNALVSSSITGKLTLAMFDDPLLVDISIGAQGDFTVTVMSTGGDGLMTLKKGELLEFNARSVMFSYRDRLFAVTLGGTLKPLLRKEQIPWPSFDVKALTVDSDGKVTLDGGWIDLPQQNAVSFYGFKLELSKFGVGQDDGGRWIGLSGGIEVSEGMPMKGSVDGLKIYLDPPALKVGGIALAFDVKDVLGFSGFVRFLDEPGKEGFAGGASVILYALKGMRLNAQFVAGRNDASPAYTYSYVFISADLPAGIPIGATGASLFGFAGLFARNMTVARQPSEPWFGDSSAPGYYLRAPKGITSAKPQDRKWMDRRDAMAFGAGLTLGTSSDDGFAFACSALFVVLVPGPVILIEGKANLLQKRAKLSEADPMFRMLAVLDSGAGTFLLNVQADYKKKDDGGLVKIKGGAEVFFDFNDPSRWHLYLGEETPESKRIAAEILKVLKANAYFMIGDDGVRLGVWAGFGDKWTFGPLDVTLKAWIEGRLAMARKPQQTEGSLVLDGQVALRVFGQGLALSVHADFYAQAPTPRLVKAGFDVKLDLPWPLPDPEASVHMEWKEDSPPPVPMALARVGLKHPLVSETWTLELRGGPDGDRDGFRGPADASASEPAQVPVVPLDARPVLRFAKPVEDCAFAGDNPRPAPAPETAGDRRYRYKLKRVALERFENGAYAVEAEKSSAAPTASSPLFGQWQAQVGEDGSVPENLVLELWADTPFELSKPLADNEGWMQGFLAVDQGYPCRVETSERWACVDFEDVKANSVFATALERGGVLFCAENVSFALGVYASPGSWAGVTKGLYLLGQSSAAGSRNLTARLVVTFPKTAGKVKIYLASGSSGTVLGWGPDGERHASSSFSFAQAAPDSAMHPVELSVDEGLERVTLEGVFLVLKVCWASLEETRRAAAASGAMTYQSDKLREHWGLHTAPLLSPSSRYRLTVETETLRAAKTGDSWEAFPSTEYAYFKTDGPPGVFTPSAAALPPETAPDPEKEVFPERGALRDLSAYVRSTVPAVAASNDPRRPFYRGYDVGVSFSAAYVEQMYLTAGVPLEIGLFDSNGDPVLDAAGAPLRLANRWSESREVLATREQKQWKAVLDSRGCASVRLNDLPAVPEFRVGATGQVLKPAAAYTAKLLAGAKAVYAFDFVTSRFCGPDHLLHSFTGKPWSYEGVGLSQATSARVTAACSGLRWYSRYAPSTYKSETEDVAFERLWTLCGFGVRPRPQALELTLLKEGSRELGLLLESPEPLDWSRLTLRMTRRAHGGAVAEALGAAKLIPMDGELGLLLREAADPSAFIVEKAASDGESFAVQAPFAAGLQPAGTILIVSSAPEAGSVWRLKDASGGLLHEHAWAGSTAFRHHALRLVRKGDGGRAFLLFNSVEGRYRLEFSYSREAVGSEPTLYRAGAAGEEKASVEFELE